MRKICRKIIITMLTAVVLAAWSGTALADWTITDLGVLADWGISKATAINNNGQVVGYASTGEFNSQGLDVNHAFLWQNGSMSDLGVIGGSSASLNSYAYGINDSGQIVGAAQVVGGDTNSYTFLYTGSAMQNLNVAGTAYGINNTGQIAGSGYNNHAFRRNSDGSIQDLGTLSTYSAAKSYGRAINSSGQVAAYDGIGMGQSATNQGFIWTNGTKQSTGTLGGTNSTIYGINNAGLVVGTSEITGGYYTHAFLYADGQRIDLGTLGDTSQANQINNNGQIVGLSDGVFDDGNSTHGVLWTINADGTVTMTDLNDLIQGQGWSLAEATGINEKGQIVGWGMVGEGFDAQQHAFLLSQETAPVPLPPAFYLFGSALAGLGALRRKLKISV
jgi:probable HAF family extracellular repeat protein